MKRLMMFIALLFSMMLSIVNCLQAGVTYHVQFAPFEGRDTVTEAVGYQAFWAQGGQLTSEGFRLHDFEMYVSNGKSHFVGVWRSGVGSNTVMKFNQLRKLSQENARQSKAGKALADLELVRVGARYTFVATWRPGMGCEVSSHLSVQELQQRIVLRKAAGWNLVQVSRAPKKGDRLMVAVWSKVAGERQVLLHGSWEKFLVDARQLLRLGQQLVDFEVHQEQDNLGVFSIWKPGSSRMRMVRVGGDGPLRSRIRQMALLGLAVEDIELVVTPDALPQPDQPEPAGEAPNCETLPMMPSYIGFDEGNRITVDFTLGGRDPRTGAPRITMPQQLLFDVLPLCPDGNIIFPNDFCGFRITKVDEVVWLQGNVELGNVESDFHPVYNTVHNFSQHNPTQYMGGVEFSGPIGGCIDDHGLAWSFVSGLTKTGGLDPNQREVRLVLELDPGARLSFIREINLQHPLQGNSLWKAADWSRLAEIAREFQEFEHLREWMEDFCLLHPSSCPL